MNHDPDPSRRLPMARHPILRSVLGQLLATATVSFAGGALGMFVGYRLLEQRVAAVEAKNIEQDVTLKQLTETTSGIRADVSYIRGRLEPRP